MKKLIFGMLVLLLQALTSGCAPVNPDSRGADAAPTQAVSAIHTQVAGTMLASAALTPDRGAAPAAAPSATVPLPASTMTVEPSPTGASQPAAVPTAVTVPTMVDVPLLKGYKSYGSRILAQPAAVVRGGMTVVVEQVAVYADHVELVYTVRDIPHELLFDPFNDDPSLSCGGPDSYPNLLLPDGTVIYPENYLLDGKARGMFEPFAGGYLIHLYRASIPAGVRELTMYLRCLELARLDLAPQDWFIPFEIVPVTGGG